MFMNRYTLHETFVVHQFSIDEWEVKPHNHNYFEIIFIEKGKGFGRTLDFHKLPMRIDFILADPAFEVKSHTNYDVVYSDHYPIMASFKLLRD